MMRKSNHRGKTMTVEYAVPCAAALDSNLDNKAALIAGTEQVMSAFLCAVQRRLGPEAARRAAGYWIEAFEAATWNCGQAGLALKRITIAAASRMAQETAATRLTGQPS